MRIGLFIPCYIDAFFPEVGTATLELLERLGHEVVDPRDQTCCGQPMANSGFNTIKTTPRDPINDDEIFQVRTLPARLPVQRQGLPN
jgi:hypothetical protein